MTHAVRATGLTATVLASTLLVTGGTAVAAPAAKHHRATVVVHATRKHKVVAPTTTRPGTARIKNTGRQPVLLVTSRHGAGAAKLARDMNADTARGLIRDFTVADTLQAKATTYLHLTRGTYYLADLSRETFTAASIKALHVRGTTVSATVPKHRAFVVTKNDTLHSPASLGTSSEVQLRNRSKHLQELWLWQVAKKATAAEVNAVLAKPSFNNLGSVVSGAPDILAILSPTMRATTSQHNAAGRYLLMTLTFSSHTNEPRLTPGQVRLVTVK